MAALLAEMCIGVYAQDYVEGPKLGEKIIGTVSATDAVWMQYPITQEWKADGSSTKDPYASKQRWYETLLEKAKLEHPGKTIDIRNLEVGSFKGFWKAYDADVYYGPAVGKIVERIGVDIHVKEILSQALIKALRNVREGSRLAIEQVTVTSSMDRETLKGQLLDVLLDKGYRVVAKDYLDKLYEEQQAQQSGIYNDKTTVQENNFSAVGYYINVKVTETSLRVQVVNVSTGEYEGNATVNF